MECSANSTRLRKLMIDLEEFVRSAQLLQKDLGRSEETRLLAIAITDSEKALYIMRAIDLDRIY